MAGNMLLLIAICIAVTMVTGQGYKPGQCPPGIVEYNSTSSDCPNTTCVIDQDCDGEEICCYNGCGQECFAPTVDALGDKTRMSLLVCEGSTEQITCDKGKNIQIMSAFWGRGDSNTCNGEQQDESDLVTCSLRFAYDYLSALCDGRSSCSIPASVGYFGNPCQEATTKYLKAVYTCENTVYRAQVCEDTGKLPISCPNNKIIVAERAFFGRADNTTCADANSIDGPFCSTDTAFDVFREYCEGKSRCEIHSHVDHFGDPCPGRNNYLQVSYTCAACQNNYGDDASCLLWALTGECSANRNWMMLNCRKACTKCDPTPPVCENVHYDDTQCDVWAADRECTGNQTAWMTVYCRKSCLRCDALTDCSVNKWDNDHGRRECPDWSANRQCSENMHYMFWDCTKSCFGCYTDSAVRCTNKYSEPLQCEKWAFEGFCQSNPGFMIPYCFKTCIGCTEDPKCENRISDSQCAVWERQGQCNANPTYMFKWCWKSCIRCEGQVCENKHTNEAECELRASQGECQTNPAFMMANCFKSCTRCGPVSPQVSECINIENDTKCDDFASSGQCYLNPRWMISNCRRSCSMCDRPWMGLYTSGSDPYPGALTNLTSSMTFLLPSYFPENVTLTHFNVFFASRDPVYLQIWAKSSNGSNTYNTKYNQRVVPAGVNYAQTVKVDGCVILHSGDLIGFSSITNRPAPIAQIRYDNGFDYTYLRNAITDYPFGDVLYPFRFSLSAAFRYPVDSVCFQEDNN